MKKKQVKFKMALSKRQYEDMLDDICSENCASEHCILKAFLVSSHPDPRILIQMKCVEKYKKQLAKEHGEISWKKAWVSWIENGYAEKFAEVYEEELTYSKIYKEVMKNE